MSSERVLGNFESAVANEKSQVDKRLVELTSAIPDEPAVIKEAVLYSLINGGKRIRPILCLWAHDLLKGANRNACLDVACAIESLHTYSLIHDDLPCMDDDKMRRGKPSCHVKFGEAVAVLAGDALLTLCFEIISSICERWNFGESAIVEATRIISRAAGLEGLIAGQVLDLQGENLQGDLEMVERIHMHKTAVLISAAMEAGSVIAGAGRSSRDLVKRTGLLAGRAFQIVDDILDLEAEGNQLGKTAGKDLAQGKLTYPAAAGMEAAKLEAASLIAEAKSNLAFLGESSLLAGLMDFLVARKF